MTGAYRHRTRLPAVAGWRRPWRGGRRAIRQPAGRGPAGCCPCAGAAPGSGLSIWMRPGWCRCRRRVDDLLAARGYINPLDGDADAQALAGFRKTPRADRGIVLLRPVCWEQWALAMGARSVSGIIRSPQHRARLEQAGIYPILDTDRALMEKVSQHSDLVFDAVGGELANTLLSVLPGSSTLISYGLLSGRPLTQRRAVARRCASFICGRRCRHSAWRRGGQRSTKSGSACRRPPSRRPSAYSVERLA